jgi:trans-aconitate methyltransferase
MTPEQREPLDALSRRLLDFHKVLLDWERANYEAEHGHIGSPAEFLNLVLDHAQFAWLRQLSGLIVEIDEALAPRSQAGAEMGDLLLAQARRLLNGTPGDGVFQGRLSEALTGSPEAARMHRELVKLLV